MSEHVGRSSGRIPPLNAQPATLEALLAWLEVAPAGTMLDARALHATLAPIACTAAPNVEPAPSASPATWSEKLWTVAPETRLGVREAAEALNRPPSFVYRHTSIKSAGASRLPHRRLDGELVFLAGELRTWVVAHEEMIERGRSDASLVLMRRAGGGS